MNKIELILKEALEKIQMEKNETSLNIEKERLEVEKRKLEIEEKRLTLEEKKEEGQEKRHKDKIEGGKHRPKRRSSQRERKTGQS